MVADLQLGEETWEEGWQPAQSYLCEGVAEDQTQEKNGKVYVDSGEKGVLVRGRRGIKNKFCYSEKLKEDHIWCKKSMSFWVLSWTYRI